MSEQQFVSDRDLVVASPTGRSALLRKGVPRSLPALLQPFALAAGAKQVSGAPAQAPEKQSKAPEIGDIVAAIKRIMDRGNPADFTAAGLIRMNVLDKEVGHDISAEDRDAAMAQIETVNEG